MYVKTFTATAIIALLVAFPLFLLRQRPIFRRTFNGNNRRPPNDQLYDIDDLIV
jgi:hypothetical protein